MYKAYGVKFVIIVQGRAGMIGCINSNFCIFKILIGKFDLKNTVINIVAGLGLLSFITMFCDFVLLNYVDDRKIVSIMDIVLVGTIFYFRQRRRNLRF